jgi:hypothetical protein
MILPSETGSAKFARIRPGKMWVIVNTERPGGEWVDEFIYHSLQQADKVADTIRSKRPSSSWDRDPYSAGIQVMDAAYYTPAMERVEALKMAGELPKELQENVENPPPSVQKLKEEMMNKSRGATGRVAWAEGEQGRKDWEKWFAEQDPDFQDTWKEMNDKYKDVVKDQHKTADQNSGLLPVELAELSGLRMGVRRASIQVTLDRMHVSYPNPRTIRLMVYAPGYSGYFEARVGLNQVTKLVDDLRMAGLTVDPDDVEAAIEMA